MSTEQLRSQRRGRRIAMTQQEVNDFLRAERTCRVGTMNSGGPHLSALWFVWDDEFLWLYSITRSQRWADLAADPRIAVLIDAGHDYFELRGVEIRGRAEVVGETPRVGEPNDQLRLPEAEFGAKYGFGAEFAYDHRHAWLRIRPEKITSWDFRKLEHR